MTRSIGNLCPARTRLSGALAILDPPFRFIGRDKHAPPTPLRRDALVASTAKHWIIHFTSSGTTSVPLRFVLRRDLLVRSVAQRWMIHFPSAGTTGVPLRPPSEGPACQVRCATLDDPFPICGHDKRAPPICPSEGPACQVRCATLDDPFPICGHDKRAPPTPLRRDLPVRSAVHRSMIHSNSSSVTSTFPRVVRRLTSRFDGHAVYWAGAGRQWLFFSFSSFFPTVFIDSARCPLIYGVHLGQSICT
jgi:hypothetical protein